MRTSIRTPKGTELPIISLKGKEYLQVAHRLVWFREEHPEWGIETEIVHSDEVLAIVRAVIRTDKGQVISTATKSCQRKSFPEHIEKAETGAIGRALALCGYGTQFAPDELDEGRDESGGIAFADSPLPARQAPQNDPGNKPIIRPSPMGFGSVRK